LLALLLVLYDSLCGRQSCLDRVASDGFQNFNSHGPVWPQTAKRNAEAFAVVDVSAPQHRCIMPVAVGSDESSGNCRRYLLLYGSLGPN